MDIQDWIGYVPYGLQFVCTDLSSGEYEVLPLSSIDMERKVVEIGATEYDFSDIGTEQCKLLLKPLEDIYKTFELSEEEVFSIEQIKKGDTYYRAFLNYSTIQFIHDYNYDFQNLIKKGHAITEEELKEGNGTFTEKVMLKFLYNSSKKKGPRTVDELAWEAGMSIKRLEDFLDNDVVPTKAEIEIIEDALNIEL